MAENTTNQEDGYGTGQAESAGNATTTGRPTELRSPAGPSIPLDPQASSNVGGQPQSRSAGARPVGSGDARSSDEGGKGGKGK